MSPFRGGALLSIGLTACGASAMHAPASAPNVLLVTIDTLRADHLGLYGYGKPTSPCLDAFAAGAVVFDAAEASASWTLPALASVMTSEFPSTHDCREYNSVLDESFPTLAEHLLAAGYDTACVTSHLFTTTRHGLQQGIVHTDDSFAYPEVDPAQNVTSQAISDKAIRFMDQKHASSDKAPWFLWLHYFDPHEEYMPHPGLSEAFVTPGERAPGVVFGDAYDGEVRYTDQHIGRVLDHLGELGFAANTVVVLLSDHGEEFFEHGATGHGHTLHSELLHVPFLIRTPGISPGRVREVVRQVDVQPTILELVGLPLPAGIAGRSLVPALRGEALEEVPSLSELDKETYHFEALRKGRLKVIRPLVGNGVSLFDLEADPLEATDLAGRRGDEARELLGELEHLKQAALERARLFGSTRNLTMTPALKEDLEGLGYGGDGAEDDEEDPDR